MKKNFLLSFAALLFVPMVSMSETRGSNEERAFEPRITNGFSTPEQYRFMAAMAVDGRYACGSAIISKRQVITAAHCVTKEFEKNSIIDSSRIVIYYGKKSLEEMKANSDHSYPVISVVTHSDYDNRPGNNNPNDIAILTVDRDFNQAQKAPLTDRNSQVDFENNLLNQVTYDESSAVAINPNLIAIGWGLTERRESPDKLQQNFLSTRREDQCQGPMNSFCSQSYTGVVKYDTCNGDSGSPVIWNNRKTGKNYVVGVVSFGRNACDATLSVYTNIYRYSDFIGQHVDNDGLEEQNLSFAFNKAPRFYDEETETTTVPSKIEFYNGAWATVTGSLQYTLGNRRIINSLDGWWLGYTNFDIPVGAKDIIFYLTSTASGTFFYKQYKSSDLNLHRRFGVSAYGTTTNNWAVEDF